MKVIPEKTLDKVCLMGQGKLCCRFLVVSGEGISCAKHSDFHKTINYRAETEQMVARGDNCEGLK